MKIGVFDSGVGGKSIADWLQKEFPNDDIVLVDDRAHLPYGDKSHEQIRELTDAAIQPILDSDIVVIACNSATTAALDWLRDRYPDKKFIGIEPMIKPAAEITKTGVVTVCATPATLSSERYKKLRQTYGAHLTVLEPDVSNWAELIEKNLINEQHIAAVINDSLERGSDVVVLGCTHYHWIKQDIEKLCEDKAVVLEPSSAIGERVRRLLAE